MEAINRAIEDASDYSELRRKLLQARGADVAAIRNRWGAELTPTAQKFMQSPRRPGESREQHRARLRTERQTE